MQVLLCVLSAVCINDINKSLDRWKLNIWNEFCTEYC